MISFKHSCFKIFKQGAKKGGGVVSVLFLLHQAYTEEVPRALGDAELGKMVKD